MYKLVYRINSQHIELFNAIIVAMNFKSYIKKIKFKFEFVLMFFLSDLYEYEIFKINW